MRLNVSIQGDKALNRALGQLGEAAGRESVLAVANEVRSQILVNLTGRVMRVRTGALRRSWSGFAHIKGSSKSPYVVLSAQKIVYARIHEYGGVIRPVRAKWLRFQAPDGAWVRTKKVVIPALRYVSIAVEYARRRVPMVVAAALGRVRASLGL